MNLSNTFKKIAGAVATSAILAGAPSVATAQNTNNQEMSNQKLLQQQEIEFNRMAEVNAGQVNAKLKSLNLPDIKIIRPAVKTKCMGIGFAVQTRDTGKVLFESNCSNFDFSNKYSFYEKFFDRIVSSISGMENLNQKSKIETKNVTMEMTIEIDTAADNFMSKHNLRFDEAPLGTCFFKGSNTQAISTACFDNHTKSVDMTFSNNTFYIKIINIDGSVEKVIGKPKFSSSTGEVISIDLK